MYPRPLKYILAALISFSANAFARSEVSSLQVVKNPRSGSFYAGLEFAMLQTSLESLTGYGLQVGYRHVLTSRWALDASLAQIYGSGSSSALAALYSGLTASVRYAPLAEFAQERSEVLFEGRRIFGETSENNRTLAVGLQMNQLFLNGSSSVYNATGLGAVVSYDTRMLGYRVRPEARYGLLSAGNADMTAIFANFLFSF
jgi:hypothetical protein